MAFAVFNIYLGVSPAFIGTALMVNRLWDAASDPFFGWLSDNTRTRFGRRRPYLLFGGIAAGLGLPLLFFFISPTWSEEQIIAYMLVSSMIYVPLMSSFNMAFQSLGNEMTPDYDERTSVMSFKGAIQKITEIGNFCALQFASMAIFNDATGRTNTLRGMQVYTGILGGIMVLIAIVMFLSVRERYYAKVVERNQEKVRLREAFFETLKCKPFRIQMLFTLAYTLGGSMVGTLGYYATVYVVCGGNEKVGNTWNTWMGVAGSVGGILGATLIARLANKLGKRHAAILTCFAAYLVYASTWWLYNPTYQWMQVVASGSIAFVCAGFIMLSCSMLADVMDYDELNTGKRREGSFSACSSYTQKVGLSLGAGAAGWILAGTGFDSKLGGAQSAHAIFMIRFFLAAIPIMGITAALFLVMKFPLTREKVAEIRKALELKRGKV
ncbi:MAG: MFS transporter [Opitutaceae bacterium]